MRQIHNYIDGRIVPAQGSATLDNVEPATGCVYSQVADSDACDVQAAVSAASRAFEGWAATPTSDRSALLLEIADRIEANLESFAQAESIDTGKPVHLARSVDIPRAISNFRFFATAILHTHTESHATDGQALNITLRRPRGVVGLISPWNLPLYLLSWKIAPALATGNTAVAKPSELTPVTASMLAEICCEAQLPPGVLNLVHGRGHVAGAALTENPAVGTISFTGGTATGRQIAGTTAASFKKLALEMGGKNPTVVFADADLDAAVDQTVRAAFSNQGQICLCGSRILVERTIYRAFVERLVQGTRALRVGDPQDESTDQGALVSESHRDKVLGYIDLARKEGGRILCGGAAPSSLPERCREGFFVEPTLIDGLAPASRVNREEIFGPVATVLPFDSETQAIEIANDTEYGLSASVWTRDLGRAHRVAGRIAVGTVWINCWLVRDLRTPFGGTKQSGVGREGGDEALRFFTESKNVCIHTPEQSA